MKRFERAYVDLRFAPHWDLIDPAREFLRRFFSVTLHDDEAGDQLCLAAHELMENAIKYSPNDEANVRVEVDGDGTIRITVENQVTSEQLARLRDEVRELNAAPDPLAHYRLRMEEASERSDGKSGLGLARIRCEAGMTIACKATADRVRVTATRPAPPLTGARRRLK
jgi:hypothetical protein